MNKKKEIIIFGAGGQAQTVGDLAINLGYKIRCFVNKNKKSNQALFGVPVIDETKLNLDCSIAIAIGDNQLRKKIYVKISPNTTIKQFPRLIHPSAVVSRYSKIGEGTIILPNAVVGTNVNIKKFSILNINSSLDHDSIMEDFTSLGPSAVTGGNVTISSLTKVEIGSVIEKSIKIAENCIIGANSFLNSDTDKDSIYFGSPAKFIKKI